MRTLQLIYTGAASIASACPFCMTMLGDGLEAKDREDIRQLDVVELLAERCGATELVPQAAGVKEMPQLADSARSRGLPPSLFDLDSRHRTGTERLLASSRLVDTRFPGENGPCNIGDLARLQPARRNSTAFR